MCDGRAAAQARIAHKPSFDAPAGIRVHRATLDDSHGCLQRQHGQANRRTSASPTSPLSHLASIVHLLAVLSVPNITSSFFHARHGPRKSRPLPAAALEM